MDNKKVSAGLSGILNPEPTRGKATGAQDPATEKTKGNYKTVCYSIPPEIAEKVRYIAWYDRKKINAVVAEAFEQYATRWEKSKPEGKQ